MKKFLMIVGVVLVAVVSAVAQQLDMMATVPNDTLVVTGKLDNGATYYIRQNTTEKERVNFHILYKVGAVLEEDRQDGLAHFLEHMAFNGSKNFQGNGLIDYCQSLGIEFGRNLNAGTGQEMTTYMITGVPVTREGILDSMLLVLHDWAGFISLNGEDIDKERGVIQEEWRMYKSMADQRIADKSRRLLFGQDNIYANRDIIGEYSNLENFTYQDIKDFYQKWYRPDLQAFVIVGDIDPLAVEAKLKAVMSNVEMPKNPTPKPKFTVEGNKEPRVGVFTDPELTSTSISLTCRLTPTNRKYNNLVFSAKTRLLNSFVSYMVNQRYMEIAKQSGAKFQRANVYTGSYFEPFDLFAMNAVAREGETYEAFEASLTELFRAVRGGFALPELERVKANFLASAEQSYNNRNERKNGEFVSAYTNNFYKNMPYMSAEDNFEMTKTLIEGITLAEVNGQIQALLTDKNVVIEASLQSKEGVEVPTEEGLLEIYNRVKASEIEPYTEEVITRPLLDATTLKGSAVKKTEEGKFGTTIWTLKNGAQVFVQPTDFKSDQVLFGAMRKGGTSTIEDLATLYSVQMLSSMQGYAGVADFTSTELQRALTGKNVRIVPYITELNEGFNGFSSKKDVETMLQLMYLHSTAPRFESEDWEVLIDKYATQLKGSEKDPMTIFQDSLASTMAQGNPRALSMMKQEYLDAVSLELLAADYQKRFSNNAGMVYFITGSVDLDSLKPLVEKYIGSMPLKKSKTAPTIGEFETAPIEGRVENHFSTPQEEGKVIVVITHNGVIEDMSLSERLNLEVAGDVLNNLYVRTIREEAGGVYTVQNMMQMKFNGKEPQFVNLCLFLTDTSKVEELIPLVYEGIEDLLNNGPTEEELQKVILAMEKNYTNSQRENSDWATWAKTYYIWGRDIHTGYMEVLKAITPQTVRAAAQRAFSQGNVMEFIQLP